MSVKHDSDPEEKKLLPTHEQILQMDRVQLRQLLAELQPTALKIKGQLSDARRKLAATGEYADSDWYTRADFAYRLHTRTISIIQGRLSVLRSEERNQNSGSIATEHLQFLHAFFRFAKRILAEEQYREICEAARAAQREGLEDCSKCAPQQVKGNDGN